MSPLRQPVERKKDAYNGKPTLKVGRISTWFAPLVMTKLYFINGPRTKKQTHTELCCNISELQAVSSLPAKQEAWL